MKPINVDTDTPTITFFNDIIKSKVPRSISVSRNTKNMPINPPKTLRNEDSNKN